MSPTVEERVAGALAITDAWFYDGSEYGQKTRKLLKELREAGLVVERRRPGSGRRRGPLLRAALLIVSLAYGWTLLVHLDLFQGPEFFWSHAAALAYTVLGLLRAATSPPPPSEETP